MPKARSYTKKQTRVKSRHHEHVLQHHDQKPLFEGYVVTLLDAFLVIEGARRGYHGRLACKPSELEKETHVQSGKVIIWEESEVRMKRWTDHLSWSETRGLGGYLVYRESDHEDPYKKYGTRQCISMSREARPFTGHLEERRQCRNPKHGWVVEDGFVKKTITINGGPGCTWHLINYYFVEDILSGALRRPSEDPSLRSLIPWIDERMLVPVLYKKRVVLNVRMNQAGRIVYESKWFIGQQPDDDEDEGGEDNGVPLADGQHSSDDDHEAGGALSSISYPATSASDPSYTSPSRTTIGHPHHPYSSPALTRSPTNGYDGARYEPYHYATTSVSAIPPWQPTPPTIPDGTAWNSPSSDAWAQFPWTLSDLPSLDISVPSIEHVGDVPLHTGLASPDVQPSAYLHHPSPTRPSSSTLLSDLYLHFDYRESVEPNNESHTRASSPLVASSSSMSSPATSASATSSFHSALSEMSPLPTLSPLSISSSLSRLPSSEFESGSPTFPQTPYQYYQMSPISLPQMPEDSLSLTSPPHAWWYSQADKQKVGGEGQPEDYPGPYDLPLHWDLASPGDVGPSTQQGCFPSDHLASSPFWIPAKVEIVE